MNDPGHAPRRRRWKTVLLAAAGLALGAAAGWSAAGGGVPFAERVRIDALFGNVGGLQDGAPVRLCGKEIGRVEALEFAPDSRVRAVLAIGPEYLAHLRQDSEAVVDTELLLGRRYVRLGFGSAGAAPLEAGGTLDGRLDRRLDEMVRLSERVIGRLDTLLDKVGTLSGELDVGGGTLARLLEDPALYEHLETSSRSLAAFLESLAQGEGTLGRLLVDERLYHELTASAEALRAFTRRLDETGGSLARFMEDPALYRNLNEASANLAALGDEIRDGEGTLGRLVRDEALYRRLNRASGRLDALLEKVAEGKGPAGRLIEDEGFGRNLAAAVTEVQKLAADIRRHPEKYFEFSLW